MSKILNEKKPKKVNFKAKLIEIGVAEQTANDWMEVRRVKKAVNTITALDRLLKQLRLAYKAGYKPEDCIGIAVEKGWKGFEYKWLENLKNDSNEQPTTTRRADARPTDSERREGYATALNGIINAENSAAIPVL